MKTIKTDYRNRQSLRLDAELFNMIDWARGLRAGNISRNTWITEAILEKIERDRRRRSNMEIGSEMDA